MRHLIGLLSVDHKLLNGIRHRNSMPVISDFGFAFEKARIGSQKKNPPKKRVPNLILV